jgi:predicted NACHT family NTPase
MFSHLSFQEFLAAKDLADPTGRKQASALRRYMLGDDWWKEVLIFYAGLLNDPYAAHEWMGSVIRGIARSKGNSVDLELKVRTATLERTIRAAYPDFKAQPILQ